MNISTITPTVWNLFFTISIGYFLIGIFLVSFTRVRTQLLADTKGAKNKNGTQVPAFKIYLFLAIMAAVAICLWPFFLSTWFSRHRKMYDIICQNLPQEDVPLPTAEEMRERMDQYEKENEIITISDATFPFPVSFTFAIGGYLGSAHQLRLVGQGELEYKFAPNNYNWELPVILTPDRAHWEEFWQAVNATNFWQWQPKYHTPCCDGTHWSICAEVSDQSKQSEGSNGYPGSDESNYPRGGQFDLFLQAVQKLTGQPEIR